MKRPSNTVLFFLLIFILVRLTFITVFPPFTDESLYTRWGQLMIASPEYRWASIAYLSRQPLAFWLFGLGGNLFGDALIGGRFVSLLLSLPAFFAVVAITKKLWGDRAATISAFLIAAAPYAILINSLAIMDGIILSGSACILWLILAFTDDGKRWRIFAIGAILGITLWIKTTALFLDALAVFSLLFLRPKNYSWKKSLADIGVVATTAILFLLPLLLRPDIAKLIGEPSSFTFSVNELLSLPIHPWMQNVWETLISCMLYFSPFLILMLLARPSTGKQKSFMLLCIWTCVTFLSMIILGKNFRMRYHAFGIIALFPLFAAGLAVTFEKLNNYRRTAEIVVAAVFLVLSGFFIFKTATFYTWFLPTSGERDYAIGWPSGYGIPELVSWIDAHASPQHPMALAVVDTPGNPTDYIVSYYYFKNSVQVLFVSLAPTELQKLAPIAQKVPLYLATRSSRIPPTATPFLTPIKRFHLPYSKETVGIYRVTFNAGM